LRQFLDTGVDIRKEPMEVAPTAHHQMGGLLVNEEAATDLKGLWATGEVVGGIQGGNRLGGNALLDTQVFGKRAGENAAKYAKSNSGRSTDRKDIERKVEHAQNFRKRKEGVRPIQVKTKLSQLMWDKVGIFRTKSELQEAISEIEQIQKKEVPRLHVTDNGTRYNHEWIEALEVENMTLVADAIARAALMREESRGAHYRTDFPKTDNKNWFVNIMVKQEGGKMSFSKMPVTVTLLKPGM